jgi:hypothetical protein
VAHVIPFAHAHSVDLHSHLCIVRCGNFYSGFIEISRNDSCGTLFFENGNLIYVLPLEFSNLQISFIPFKNIHPIGIFHPWTYSSILRISFNICCRFKLEAHVPTILAKQTTFLWISIHIYTTRILVVSINKNVHKIIDF